jgi:hypothetical protein
MIISHSRKFIFVKTTKTGGTSLELALSKYCTDGDVITPLTDDEEELRRRLGGVKPQNYELPLSEYDRRALIRRLMLGSRRKKPPKYTPHLPAKEIKKRAGPEVWDSYFKFTIIRHPYDRIVSGFFYMKEMIPLRSIPHYHDLECFDQFIRYRAQDINWNWHIYTENDQILVDHVVRYEHLRDDLELVSERIGLDCNLYDDMRTIRAKSEYRPRCARSSDFLTERHKQVISTLCAKEMSLFGYAGDDEVRRASDAARGVRERAARSSAMPAGLLASSG